MNSGAKLRWPHRGGGQDARSNPGEKCGLGLHRLQHRLDEMAATEEWIAGGRFLRVVARYDPEANRIHVIARLYSFAGSAEQARRKCAQLLNAVRTTLGVYPPFGQPAAPTSDLVEFFLHDGQAAGSGMDVDRVGRALDKIVRLHVEIMKPEDLRAGTQCAGPLLGTQVKFDE